jgi:gluconate 2-dehydrogenase gamma chain
VTERNPSPVKPSPLAGGDDRLSRREFLARSGGAALAATGTLALATACTTSLTTSTVPPQPTPLPLAEQYPAVPVAPAAAPREITVLTEHEAATLEALMARMLPGEEDDPGAREAGVIYYLDHMLGAAGGFPEATYREGPYAITYEGDTPPTDEETALAQGIVWVPADQIERYGYQSPLTPLDVCQVGVRAVDQYAQERFGRPVAELSDDEQDQIVSALLDNEASGFELFSPESFFHALRRHTDEGMFSDPLYGGNRDFIGWNLIGFPGAQRAYTETDIRTPGSPRQPQGLAELHHFNPGRPAGYDTVVLPVRGSAGHEAGGAAFGEVEGE